MRLGVWVAIGAEMAERTGSDGMASWQYNGSALPSCQDTHAVVYSVLHDSTSKKLILREDDGSSEQVEPEKGKRGKGGHRVSPGFSVVKGREIESDRIIIDCSPHNIQSNNNHRGVRVTDSLPSIITIIPHHHPPSASSFPTIHPPSLLTSRFSLPSLLPLPRRSLTNRSAR